MAAGAQPRSRLTVDTRREQLVRAGVELLRTNAPDAVSVDAVARKAGVSRGLLYHYFEDKDAFVIAVLEQAGERLRVALRPDPSRRERDQIPAAIDGFIAFAEAHAAGFSAVLTGGVANRKVAAVVDRTRERDLEEFVAAVAAATGARQQAIDRDVLRVALHAHMHFMEGAVVRWLSHREIKRDQLRDLILGTLDGTIAAAEAVAQRGA